MVTKRRDADDFDRLVEVVKAHDRAPAGAASRTWGAIQASLGGATGTAASAWTLKGLFAAGIIVGGSGGAVIGIVTHDPSPSSGGSPAVSEPSHASAFESEAPAGRPAASDPRASPVPSVAGVGKESTLAIQARLLGDAWAALERDDLEGALAKLRSHQDAFPQSPLAEDREACRRIVECRMGHPEARARATAYLTQHHTAAERVRAACLPEISKKSTPP